MTRDTAHPKPGRILIADFNTRDVDVTEYQGILRQQPANPDVVKRQRELDKLAVTTLAAELAEDCACLGSMSTE